MNCPEPLELSAYFDRELSERRSEEIKEHLRACPHCRVILEGWVAAQTPLNELPVEEESKRRILGRVRSCYSTRSFRIPIPIAAAALLTLALSLLLNFLLLAGVWQPFHGKDAGGASAGEYRVEAVRDPELQRTLEHYKLRSRATILIRPVSHTGQPGEGHHEKE
jgi:hypothetical protein